MTEEGLEQCRQRDRQYQKTYRMKKKLVKIMEQIEMNEEDPDIHDNQQIVIEANGLSGDPVLVASDLEVNKKMEPTQNIVFVDADSELLNGLGDAGCSQLVPTGLLFAPQSESGLHDKLITVTTNIEEPSSELSGADIDFMLNSAQIKMEMDPDIGLPSVNMVESEQIQLGTDVEETINNESSAIPNGPEDAILVTEAAD